jgi:hypothetical protein
MSNYVGEASLRDYVPCTSGCAKVRSGHMYLIGCFAKRWLWSVGIEVMHGIPMLGKWRA